MHQLQERHDVLIVGDDAVEFLQQIEHDVAASSRVMAPRNSDRLSLEADGPDLMALGFQMRNDVVLGAPLVDLLLGGALQRIRRHQRRVHQDQGRSFLTLSGHSDTLGNWRSS